MHLYLASPPALPRREGAGSRTDAIDIKQLTKGNFVVDEILGFCAKTKSVIIRSNEAAPLQMNLWSVNIENGKRTLIDKGKGVHKGKLSESGLYISDSYSEPTVPHNIDILFTTNKKPVRYLTAKNPWEGYQVPEYINGTIKAADGVTDLYWRMVRPADFDANKKYPTVVYVYGGPHAHNVDASWHWASRSWETYKKQKGYIVFILDNRGSENR